jgi:hypothetical protein
MTERFSNRPVAISVAEPIYAVKQYDRLTDEFVLKDVNFPDL